MFTHQYPWQRTSIKLRIQPVRQVNEKPVVAPKVITVELVDSDESSSTELSPPGSPNLFFLSGDESESMDVECDTVSSPEAETATAEWDLCMDVSHLERPPSQLELDELLLAL